MLVQGTVEQMLNKNHVERHSSTAESVDTITKTTGLSIDIQVASILRFVPEVAMMKSIPSKKSSKSKKEKGSDKNK